MFEKKEDGVSVGARPTYAHPHDFCRIFTEDQTALFLLSLLLTADPEKAEQCFVAGLEDSIHGNPVFKEWARSWSKRVIIKSAIRLISPAPGQIAMEETGDTLPVFDSKIFDSKAFDSKAFAPNFHGSLTSVMQLAPFERFVFVMSILEGYSMQECSILLNCTRQEVEDALARGLTAPRNRRDRPSRAGVRGQEEKPAGPFFWNLSTPPNIYIAPTRSGPLAKARRKDSPAQ